MLNGFLTSFDSVRLFMGVRIEMLRLLAAVFKNKNPFSAGASGKASSFAEQIMPLDGTPLNSASLITSPLGITAPTLATTTFALCPRSARRKRFEGFPLPHSLGRYSVYPHSDVFFRFNVTDNKFRRKVNRQRF